MRKVTPLIRTIGIVLIGVMAVATALFLINIALEKNNDCIIEIKNDGQDQLILKTFLHAKYDNKLAVDSIAIGPGEKFEIGRCANCTTPDTLDIHFETITFYDAQGKATLMNRKEMIKYLETKDKEGCITYSIR